MTSSPTSAGRQSLHVIVHDPRLQVHHGPADGAGFFKRHLFFQSGYTGCRLAHAEPLLQDNTGLVVLLDQADWQGRAAAHDNPDGFECFGFKLRMLNKRQEYGRHTEEKRDFFFAEQGQGLSRIKGALDDHRSAIINHRQGE